jgi:hypothetical protein
MIDKLVKIYLSINLLFLGPVSAASYVITKENLQSHVAFLTSNLLEGRLTGSQGEKLAADYIAKNFLRLGLAPAGDNGTFFQEFDFIAGVSLGKNNSLSVINKKNITTYLLLDRDWRPLPFSDSISFANTEFVFAGYGISAPALGKLPAYDSYAHLNVKNKWVIVFRYAPEKISAERTRQLAPYSSLRYKAFTAKNHGAYGIIFVSGPNAKVNEELVPLSFDTSLSGSGIVAFSVKDQTINDLLKDNNSKVTLKKMQDSLDKGKLPFFPALTRVKMTGNIDIKKNIRHGHNVLAKIRITFDAKQMLIIGAHLDHLGHGELSGSLAQKNEVGMIHPGADDNASGVASLMETAATLSALKAQGKLSGNKDILLAAWSGEEFGILGSSHFARNLMQTAKIKSLQPVVDAVINLDMIGHLNKRLVLQGSGSSSDWQKVINKIMGLHSVTLVMQKDPYLPTDSTVFYLHGVPTLNFFTGAHANYHTPRDKSETLNYIGIKNISEFLVDLILTLELEPTQLSYHEIKRQSDKGEREFKIYLGTIPNYASADISGVKLSGVAKGSPADQAGLKKNDIIVQLAGKNIHDIYDYTFALNALHVGQPVKMVVRRNKTQKALTIVARYR